MTTSDKKINLVISNFLHLTITVLLSLFFIKDVMLEFLKRHLVDILLMKKLKRQVNVTWYF